MQLITSSSNPKFKNWIKSSGKKGKYSSYMKIEGIRLCNDAVISGYSERCRAICISQSGFEKPEIKSLLSNFKFINMEEILYLSDELFEKISDTVHPQGIIAYVEPFFSSNSPFVSSDATRVCILEHLQDPGNLGAIWRSADAMGFDAIYVSADSVSPLNSKAVRSAMGAALHIPVYTFNNIIEMYDYLKSAGFIIISTALDGTELDENNTIIRDLSSKKIAVVIGNEGSGLTQEAICSSDFSVKIPMRGRAESLNAACAASILFYMLRK